MLTARANWYSNGMADSAQLMGRYFWPSPPHTPEPNKTRMKILTLEEQDYEPGLVVQPMA